MNTRRVATGTFLSASLLLGGTSLADASPGSRPAMDRGVVPCQALENRMAGLQHHLDQLAAKRDRVEDRLAAAQADGDARRVRRIEAKLAQVDRATAKLTVVMDALTEAYDDRCEPFVQPE